MSLCIAYSPRRSEFRAGNLVVRPTARHEENMAAVRGRKARRIKLETCEMQNNIASWPLALLEPPHIKIHRV